MSQGLPANLQAAVNALSQEPVIDTTGLRVITAPPAPLAPAAPLVESPPEPVEETVETETEPAEGEIEVAETEEIVAAPAEEDKLTRAAKAANAARKGAKRNRELIAEQEQIRRQASATQAELQRVQQENLRQQNFQRLMREDPYTALKQLGMTDAQIIQRGLKEGSPELVLERIQQDLANERAARLQLEKNLQAKEAQIEGAAVRNKFLRMITNEKLYPTLAEQPEWSILANVPVLRQEIIDAGGDPRAYNPQEIAEALEAKFARAKANKAKKNGTAPAPKPGTKPPVTLTNKLGTSKFSMPIDKFDELSKEDQNAHLEKMALTMFKP